MAVLTLFAVRDVKLGAYLPPFVAANKVVAMRMLGDAVQSEGHPLSKHPQDYELYQVGLWYEETGAIVVDDSGVSHVCNVSDLIC